MNESRKIADKNIDADLKDIMSCIKEYALFAVNLEGNITYFGMGSEHLFGWSKNEIIFKDASLLFSEGDSGLVRILGEVKARGRYEAEIELKKSNGSLFPVDLTVTQLKDPDSKLTGYILIAKDITGIEKPGYRMFQAEKMAAISLLASGMAHEINNPLFVISGRLELLKDEPGISDSVRQNLGIIYAQADRIRNLVDRLLKFTRKSIPHLDTISINEVIESVLPLVLCHKLPDSNVAMEKHLGQNLPVIKGDFNQLQEVFVNLLRNAYQSMPQGGKLCIYTSAVKEKFVQVIISDTGLGIPANSLKNVFLPFFSTKKDGAGLGLSICYNIIINHSGNIEIESEPDKGTTFIIKLPFA